jgi:flagellar basal-body rod modification protein FlgD
MQTLAVGPPSAPVAAPPRRGLNDLKSEDFFKLLVTEMQQQDPLEPTKTADMIGQVSQIRSIELSGQLTDTLELLAKQQRILGASDLIGRFVTAVIEAPDGTQVEASGVVTGVRFDADGSAILELDTGEAVPASSVQWVTTAEETPAEQPNGEGTADHSSGDAQSKAEATAKTKDKGPWSWLSLDGSLRL